MNKHSDSFLLYLAVVIPFSYKSFNGGLADIFYPVFFSFLIQPFSKSMKGKWFRFIIMVVSFLFLYLGINKKQPSSVTTSLNRIHSYVYRKNDIC